MSKCDIKSSAKAWNDGIDAFEKAFMHTGGKTTESLQFAMDEARRKNPDVDFDSNSFVDPLLSSLKADGLVPKNYTFNKTSKGAHGRIEKVVNRMEGLDANQKKKVAREAFEVFQKDGTVTEEKVKNIYADALGLPAMNDKLGKQIESLAKARQEADVVDKEIDGQIRAMQDAKDANGGKLTPAQNQSFQQIFAGLSTRRSAANAASMKQASAFANALQEKKFWLHQLTDYMTLNLMNPNSLIKNVTGAVADGLVRTIGNTLSSPVSMAISYFTKVNSNPVGARVRGAAKSKLREKASAAWRHGITDFNNELPRANNLAAVERMKKAMQDSGFEKWKGIVSGILKVHPALVSKGLTVPDAMAFEMVKSAELQRIAEAKGLKGAEQEAFLLKPDEKSMDVAMDLAKKATFKQDLPEWMSGLNKISAYDPHEATKKLIQEKNWSPMAAKLITAARAIIQKSALPFIKTPINIVRTASTILLPEYTAADALVRARKETDPIEKQRIIVDGMSRATAGFFLRVVVLDLISKGLISAGYSDEDRKTKDIVEQELGGPNRVNYSAFVRGMTFRSTDKKAGDKYVDLSSLGAAGVALAVYAHAFGKYDKDEIENRTNYNRNLANIPGIPWDLAWGLAATAMDFTFFTGINQLQGAIMNKEGYETKQLAANYIANMFTGIIPATAQKLSTQSDPNVKKQFDKDLSFGKNLQNVLGYRFAFQSENLKDKYFSLAQGDATKKKQSVFFDNYWGRVLESEFDFAKVTGSAEEDSPIGRLYKASRDVPKENRDDLFPSSISDNVSIQYKKKNKKVSANVQLDDVQYDYLQQQASNYRMLLATPFIMSEDFDKASPEIKSKVLQSFYTEGLKYAKEDLRRQYPDILSQRTEEPTAVDAKKLTKKYKSQKPN